MTRITPQVQWVTASPLWQQLAADPTHMQRPALLRFASDSFMQDLITLLNTTPEQLSRHLATYESFSVPLPGAETAASPEPPQPLKLYQPVHGHFCLVAASLVCRVVGLPDRVVDAANGDQIRFVMRRLRADDRHEMAWVPADRGPGRQWRVVETPTEVAPGEELLPMFPVQFTSQQNGRRRLAVGLIPTSSREVYQGAAGGEPLVQPAEQDFVIGQTTDQRYAEFDTRVLGALRGLRDAMTKAASGQRQQLSDHAQEAFLFMLLDFADFLARHMLPVWQAVQGGAPALAQHGAALVALLQSQRIVPGVPSMATWQTALRTAWAERTAIIAEPPGPLPQHYDLTGLTTVNLPDSVLEHLGQALNAALGDSVALVQAGSEPAARSGAVQTATSAAVPKLDARPGTAYVLRCVFQRPACAPLYPDVVSNPTVPFAIAPYFDFDAPARPIRITMPVDTSIAGLRKFNKNVAFLISDHLRKQMARATDLKSLMDGNLAAEQPFDLGVICSFSIPIITICALIMLLIIVNLLNIIFWWLPLFRICLPISLKRG